MLEILPAWRADSRLASGFPPGPRTRPGGKPWSLPTIRHLIISTIASDIQIEKQGDSYLIFETYPRPASVGRHESSDFGIAAFSKLCRLAAGREITPVEYEVICDRLSMRVPARFLRPEQLLARLQTLDREESA